MSIWKCHLVDTGERYDINFNTGLGFRLGLSDNFGYFGALGIDSWANLRDLFYEKRKATIHYIFNFNFDSLRVL